MNSGLCIEIVNLLEYSIALEKCKGLSQEFDEALFRHKNKRFIEYYDIFNNYPLYLNYIQLINYQFFAKFCFISIEIIYCERHLFKLGIYS